MNSSSSFSKHHASSAIEDISEQAVHVQQNWLLTYLDVFVLIIMLVITLISLKDFETDQHSKKKQNPIKEKQVNLKELVQLPVKAIKVEQPPLIKKQPIIQPPIEHISNVEEVEDLRNDKNISDKQSNKNKLQEQLTKTIKELGLNNAVDMKVTLGYAQLEIQDKILFKSSEAKLLDDGQALLKKLAPLLAQSLGLIFIEGHTDNRPIKTEKFPSNWELGASRATNVLRYLITQDIDTSRLRAISSAATKPIADNATTEGREKNRRVSIMIQVADKI